MDTPAPARQALLDVFVTALEGGIGYWSVCRRYRWALPDGEEDLDGFHAVIEETESGDDVPPVHRIDAAVILRGLQRLAAPGDGYRDVRAVARAILAGDEDATCDCDAEVADCIVQAGLFDEVVYG
jgi:hypothetical protein